MAQQTKIVEPHRELTSAQKWYSFGACVVAALLIRYAAQLALWPRDPGLPVAFLTCGQPMLAMLETAAVAAAGAALVAAVVGRWLPGVGAFAVGAGFVVLGWSGGDWRLLVAGVQVRSGSWDALHAKLLAETLGWGVCVACALAAEKATRRWMGLEPPGAAGPTYSRISAWISGLIRSREQWAMWLAAGLGGIILIDVLYARIVAAPLGQGFFIVAVSLLLGVLLGHQVFTVKAVWPAALAWLIPAIGGAIWAMAGDERPKWFLVGINPLANLLPIQYAGGGTLGGILGLWCSHKLLRWRQDQLGGAR